MDESTHVTPIPKEADGIFTKELLPLASARTRADAEAVMLSVTTDEIQGQGWDQSSKDCGEAVIEPVLTSAEAAKVLAAYRLYPGPDGFSFSQIVAFATQHRWNLSTVQAANGACCQWQASVSNAGVLNGPITGARGYGASEEDALVIALATMVQYV